MTDSELKNTPLPWDITTWNDDRSVHAISGADSRLVCNIREQQPSDSTDIANAKLIVKAVNTHQLLVDALEVVIACGEPERISLYDEEGIEGWAWYHPDGREWAETGDWGELPPIHPIIEAALKAARGCDENN